MLTRAPGPLHLLVTVCDAHPRSLPHSQLLFHVSGQMSPPERGPRVVSAGVAAVTLGPALNCPIVLFTALVSKWLWAKASPLPALYGPGRELRTVFTFLNG